MKNSLVLMGLLWAATALTDSNGAIASQENASLISSSTEQAPEGVEKVPAAVLREILKPGGKSGVSGDDLAQLDDCVEENHFKPKDYSRLFVSKAVPASQQGVSGYFIRPALKPYCQAFYGAHVFRYWFVTLGQAGEKPKVVFAGNSDAVSLLSSTNQSYHNIETVDCIVSGCKSTFYSFNGKKYVQSLKPAPANNSELLAAITGYVQANSHLNKGFRAVIEDIAGNYARARLEPADEREADVSMVYMKKDNGQWQGLALGTSFSREELGKLGIPPNLYKKPGNQKP